MAHRNQRFEGKVAIVTGAAQGMGATFAKMFAAQGAAVVVSDVNAPGAQKVAEEITANSGRAIMVETDLRKCGPVRALVDETLRNFQTVSILVNNAGVLRRTRCHEISEEEWDLLMEVNMKGVFFCSQAVIAPMKANNWGRIINISSSAGRSVSTIGGVHYTASKAGVLGITRGMAKELAPHGITVNAICPGLIDTEMVRSTTPSEEIHRWEQSFPIPRLGTPEEVAWLVGFLASDEAAYITGASFDINGGDLMI